MRNSILSMTCLAFMLTCSSSSQAQFKSLKDYYASLDVSCNADEDCTIANVGNCCGYYPRCLNKSAKPDPTFVREFCAKEEMMGECGFKAIKACKCENSKCVAQSGLSFEEKPELVPLPPSKH